LAEGETRELAVGRRTLKKEEKKSSQEVQGFD